MIKKTSYVPEHEPTDVVTPETYDGSRLDFAMSDSDKEYADALEMHGLKLLGWYRSKSTHETTLDPAGGNRLPVVSFHYHKSKENESFETASRIMIWDGGGYGVYGGHEGQKPASYLIGCQIGIEERGSPRYQPEKYGRRNFSMDCIMGGDFGDNPIDARTGEPLNPELV